jgi:hypothetical protein
MEYVETVKKKNSFCLPISWTGSCPKEAKVTFYLVIQMNYRQPKTNVKRNLVLHFRHKP